MTSKRAKDIDIVPALLSLSRLIVLCQFANWLWIRSRSSDHLSVSGQIVWTQPRKTWNKWTFLNGTHTENTMSMKHWSMSGGNHCSSTAISYFVSCLVCDISLSGHFGNMIDLIIEALPICNNLSAIVILRISFPENKLWPCSQSLGYNGYFSLYSFISFILWNWGQIANLAGQLPRQRQRGPATHIMGLYCVILPEFLALLTSFDWCGESKAIYFISAAGD